jgi:hypothetical protein
MTTATREQLETELDELRKANEAAPCWGAAVGARIERIREIKSALRRLDSTKPVDF